MRRDGGGGKRFMHRPAWTRPVIEYPNTTTLPRKVNAPEMRSMHDTERMLCLTTFVFRALVFGTPPSLSSIESRFTPASGEEEKNKFRIIYRAHQLVKYSFLRFEVGRCVKLLGD